MNKTENNTEISGQKRNEKKRNDMNMKEKKKRKETNVKSQNKKEMAITDNTCKEKTRKETKEQEHGNEKTDTRRKIKYKKRT